eukprot:NODE_277_length_1548_cov_292.615077_g201_i0.p1 GENE.NODE_277_length_1548_cov_292.615077_g201_i0~~NODE_277_length_1548_cov_292.615077_g201_i0.p1  ORF type:complete len:317 (+),score=127.48 NODE_277_length_1548_cov_292.615077_g201_i0:50-952(+)
MAEDRAASYASTDPAAAGFEQLSKKLSAELRTHIRQLACYPLFSREWSQMAEVIQHLTSIALMEDRVPDEKKAGTLWDREELCVRYIVEEGKTNLLLRMLVDLKAQEYKGLPDSIPAAESARTKTYEIHLGMLFRMLLSAVEVLKTADTAAVADHIAVVLTHATQPDFALPSVSDCHCLQEVLVVEYLFLIASHLDESSEGPFMTAFSDKGIFDLICTHYQKFKDDISIPDFQRKYYALFFAHVMETEAFATHKNTMLANPTTKETIIQLEERAKALGAADAKTKTALRPLLDQIAKLKL